MEGNMNAYQGLQDMLAKGVAQQANPLQQIGPEAVQYPNVQKAPPPPLREQLFAIADRLGMLEQRFNSLEAGVNRLCDVLLKQVGVTF